MLTNAHYSVINV